MKASIHSRLLLAASLVLAGFLGITGWVLDAAFRTSAEASMQANLESRIYALLGAIDVDGEGRMVLPRELPDPAFSKPDSGLYAMVVEDSGHLFWRSPSLTGRRPDMVVRQGPGSKRFATVHTGQGELLVMNMGVAWEDDRGEQVIYTFAVAEDTAAYRGEVAGFRKTLWMWLGGLAVGLLLVQGGILRWGLRPLRRVSGDLADIEQGKAVSLEGDYPLELTGLTDSLNSLMRHGRNVQQRYRNSLDDLAHSLKTPLALLQALSEDRSTPTEGQRQAVVEQVERMNSIVRQQLQRAAVSGRAALAKPVPVAHQVERLIRTLDKVYQDKQIQVTLDLDRQSLFRGDETDLLELLGNLIENAYKYGDSRLKVVVSKEVTAENNNGLRIQVEDDGPGIANEQLEYILQRGKRGDESLPGHGIGLAMVDDITRLYCGSMDLLEGSMGGLLVRLVFPSPVGDWKHSSGN